jgi:hypothetical protein
MMEERELHPLKDATPNISTEDGIQIDESDEDPPNTSLSIRESREPDSNVIIERD